MSGATVAHRRLAWVAVAPFAAGALLLGSARWFWMGDLAASFAWQLGLAELAVAAILMLLRSWRPAGVLVLLASLHAGPELSLWLPRPRGEAEPAATFTLVSHNLLFGNRDRAGFGAWLRHASPDVAVLSEVSVGWRAFLEELEEDYPYQMFSPADERWNQGTWGTAVLSRVPFESTRLIEPSVGSWRPPMEARVLLGGRAVTVRGVHALRPGGRANIERRNAALMGLAAEEWDATSVLAGDLNVTSTVPVFGELLERTGLCDSRRGFGRQPTFRVDQRHGPTVAIDHVLVGEALRVLERRTEEVPHSDHRAVVAVIGVGAVGP